MLKFSNQLCTGCHLCEAACSASHYQVFAPTRSRIKVAVRPQTGEAKIAVCFSCPKAPCIPACPKGAISRPAAGQPLAIDLLLCDGCGACVPACPYGAMQFDAPTSKAIACDLCGGDPQCVNYCYPGAITYKSKE